MNATRKLPWLLALVIALVLAAAAAGCGGDDDDGTATTPAGTGEAEAPAEEPISVGMVSDTGGVDDRGFNQFSGTRRINQLRTLIPVAYPSGDADAMSDHCSSGLARP